MNSWLHIIVLNYVFVRIHDVQNCGRSEFWDMTCVLSGRNRTLNLSSLHFYKLTLPSQEAMEYKKPKNIKVSFKKTKIKRSSWKTKSKALEQGIASSSLVT